MKTWDLERRIRRVWERSTRADYEQGSTWYQTAREWVQETALEFGWPAASVAGALAAISPGNEWESSKRQLVRLLQWIADFQPPPRPAVGTYSTRNVDKAVGILLASERPEWPHGPKVSAFYALLVREGPEVCVDSHAVNIAHGVRRNTRETRVKASEVRRVREAYLKLAHKLGVQPHVLQAVTWVAWKREGEEVPF